MYRLADSHDIGSSANLPVIRPSHIGSMNNKQTSRLALADLAEINANGPRTPKLSVYRDAIKSETAVARDTATLRRLISATESPSVRGIIYRTATYSTEQHRGTNWLIVAAQRVLSKSVCPVPQIHPVLQLHSPRIDHIYCILLSNIMKIAAVSNSNSYDVL
ncbi:hypothetical protein CANCADRAFT_103061 [Tortispora caseinolytica NRRL Y-17796]|uniref:Uncharacterized protein n=1 Tax=Tortispora caseinolytica NRRL Y-17796 TaxID=767744 RepID=A0A1E4TEX8_9ASCO|nr:hypothetical protein CANCADRAFT_103061 [Tortispora caseinolytica NRRL Y-17796]